MSSFSEKYENFFKSFGSGFLVAATGVGAGDIVAASVAGATYGMAVAWAVVIGSLLKYALNEGLARWQLATGTTLFEGWVKHFGKGVQYYFLFYLVFWSFFVGTALINACGLAANALFPSLSVRAWGVIHSLLAAFFVLYGGYSFFEKVMGIFTALMFVTFIGCASLVHPPFLSLWESLSQISMPQGSASSLLSVIGGVGGSLTLLSYGYWIREKGWKTAEAIPKARRDLFLGYFLTGLFAYSLIVLSAKVLHAQSIQFQGDSDKVLQMSLMLKNQLGSFGQYLFILGFWAAVFTSLLGVWQSVPTLFCDFVSVARKLTKEEQEKVLSSRSRWYRGYLFYLTFAPLPLVLFFPEPFYLIILYTLVGSFFMPFLAGTLLIMNSKSSWIGSSYRYSWVAQLFLGFCLLLFIYLCFTEIQETLQKYQKTDPL
jgi:Mn2+/Fe2+ NRAMP family transporter